MYSPTQDFLLRQEIQRDKPLGYWPLDTDTFAVDFRAAPSPNPGSYSGGFYSAPGPFGAGSRSAGFDGVNGQVALPSGLSLAAGSAVTIEFWAYIATADISQSGALCTIGNLNTPNRMSPNIDSGTLFWDVNSFVGGRISTSIAGLGGNWFHVTVASSGSANTFQGIYINEALVASQAASLDPGALTGGYIAAWPGVSLWAKARMAHFAVYNYVLSPSRIAARMTATRPRSRRAYSYTTRPRSLRFMPAPQLEDDLLMRRVRRAFAGPAAFVLRQSRITRPENLDEDRSSHLIRVGPRMIDYGRRYGGARGLYRIFNPALYQFYKSNVGPPNETDIAFATSATLPATPANTYADGTWYLSAQYFNGVLSSGFLPLGKHGETYVLLEIAGGVSTGTRPSGPTNAALEVRAGGVIRINAFYLASADGANAADTWSISYTTNGTTPANDSPTITKAMTKGPLQVLAFDLPAQADGTTVKVQLQTRRSGTVYSLPSTVLIAVADATGPTVPVGGDDWAGALPEVL